MEEQGSERKTESSIHLAGMEEKLSALHSELKAVEEDYAALIMRVNACCHNETYYAAAVGRQYNEHALYSYCLHVHCS